MRQGSNEKHLDLFPQQRAAATFLRKRRGRALLLMKMRSGKTRATLTYLGKTDARRILIVCPKSAVYVWREELRAVNREAKIAIVVDLGSKRAQQKITLASEYDGPVYLVINWETYWRYPAEHRLNKTTGEATYHPLRGTRKVILEAFRPDSLVWDEAQRLKHRTSKQSAFANILEQQPYVKRAISLTGTAITEGIEDLFAIYRATDKTVFGSSFADFDRRYIIRGGYGGYQIKGYRRVEEVERKLQESAYQYEGSPDDIEDVIVPVALEPKAQDAYRQMKRDAIAEIEGLDEDGKPTRGTALARIVLTNILRLQQITGGFIMTDAGPIEIGSEKLKAALEIISDSLADNRRVVVFCRFLNELRRLSRALPKAGLIHGAVSALAREREIEALRSGKRDVLIAQVAAGGVSVDLSGASVEIFYSMGYSLADFLQARARLLGPRQTSSVTNYILQARGTIDGKVFKALMAKQRIAQRVTSLSYAKGLIS